MESDKTVNDNVQEELRKKLKSKKVVSTHKSNELQTCIYKLQAIVDGSKYIAIEVEDKLNATTQDREDAIAQLKTVQHKLGIKIEQAIKHDEECYKSVLG